MGPSRKTVIQNRDIIKELKVGMLIAIAESDIARVGKVLAIPIKYFTGFKYYHPVDGTGEGTT